MVASFFQFACCLTHTYNKDGAPMTRSKFESDDPICGVDVFPLKSIFPLPNLRSKRGASYLFLNELFVSILYQLLQKPLLDVWLHQATHLFLQMVVLLAVPLGIKPVTREESKSCAQVSGTGL